jgi:hypothetical protein
MPYKINFTNLMGQRVALPEIHRGRTPAHNDVITVNYPGGVAKAQVTGVQTFPSKSPGTAVETVDQIDAQEM